MGQLGTHDAATFHALHAPGELLILANVWDAGTARVVEAGGARALATSSAAVAWACGYADRGPLPPSVLAGAVRSIARVIAVPLSVDAENGYSDDPRQVAETVRALMDAGAVGIVVPCHRVIGANGALTGFGGGLPRKQWLLEHEGAQLGLFRGSAA